MQEIEVRVLSSGVAPGLDLTSIRTQVGPTSGHGGTSETDGNNGITKQHAGNGHSQKVPHRLEVRVSTTTPSDLLIRRFNDNEEEDEEAAGSPGPPLTLEGLNKVHGGNSEKKKVLQGNVSKGLNGQQALKAPIIAKLLGEQPLCQSSKGNKNKLNRGTEHENGAVANPAIFSASKEDDDPHVVVEGEKKAPAFPELELDLARMVRERLSQSELKTDHKLSMVRKNKEVRMDMMAQYSSNSLPHLISEFGKNNSCLGNKEVKAGSRSSSSTNNEGQNKLMEQKNSVCVAGLDRRGGAIIETKKRRLDLLLNKKFSSTSSDQGSISSSSSRSSTGGSTTVTVSSVIKDRRHRGPSTDSLGSKRRKRASPSSSSNASCSPPSSSSISPPLAPTPSTRLFMRPASDLLSSGDEPTKIKMTAQVNSSEIHLRSPPPLQLNLGSGKGGHMPALQGVGNDLLMTTAPLPGSAGIANSNAASNLLSALPPSLSALLNPHPPSSPSPVSSASSLFPGSEDLIKNQFLQIHMAQLATSLLASTPSPTFLPGLAGSPDMLKMASLLAAVSGCSTNPLLGYSYYSHLLQAAQRQQQQQEQEQQEQQKLHQQQLQQEQRLRLLQQQQQQVERQEKSDSPRVTNNKGNAGRGRRKRRSKDAAPAVDDNAVDHLRLLLAASAKQSLFFPNPQSPTSQTAHGLAQGIVQSGSFLTGRLAPPASTPHLASTVSAASSPGSSLFSLREGVKRSSGNNNISSASPSTVSIHTH